MTDFVPSEKGVTIRQPSTANLMVDSRDGIIQGGTSSDFSITRANSILNGFFTRIGVTEHVLEWKEPNISAALKNNTITYDVSGYPVLSLTFPDAFYTAQAAYQDLVQVLNDVSGSVGNLTWTVLGQNGYAALIPSSNTAQVRLASFIPDRLGLAVPTYSAPGANLIANSSLVDLRPYRYLDFVSAQLTYNQDLKDATTSRVVRDVLTRWYFSYDQPPALDGFGFPILMGYTPFCLRRIFNPPKQIKWSANQPVGQLAFQVYPDAGRNAPINMPNSLWEMTLQVSEV